MPALRRVLCACLLGMAVAGSAAAQAPAAPSTAAPPAAPAPPAVPPGTLAAEQPLPISADELLAYVHRVLDWYHHVSQIAQLPGVIDDPVTRDRLQNQALTVLQLAFEMAKAAAALVAQGAPTAAAHTTGAGVLAQVQQAAGNLRFREAALAEQLAALDTQIKLVKGEARKALQLRRDSLAASLDLVHEGQASMKQMLEFANRAATAGGENQGGLAMQLTELQRSAPQLEHETGTSRAGAAATPPVTTFRAEAAGILALVSQAFALRGTQSQMASLRKETDALLAELARLRKAAGTQARDVMQGSLAATEELSNQQTAALRQSIEAGTARFKLLAAVVVPLSEQVLVLTNARSTLEEWGRGIDTRLLSVMRYFAVRLGVLLASVLAVLVASDLWRRATLRYVRDPNRRRPLLVLRRLLVGLALVIVIAFGLASEVGSLATFMGFLTAGIAVTLQNVILSVVAYFFLIGRYGVQVGDRITLAGVTGRVVDVSLLRLYLLELAGNNLHSTGRLVVLSNAVLLQPQALYKQIPGADYLWHTATVTLEGGADIEEASRRLEDAAREVFDQYRDVIDRQHARMLQQVDFQTAPPRPQVRVEGADDGLKCSVRYPVPSEQAAAIDQQMLESLRHAIENGGAMKLKMAGAVKLTWDS